MLSLQLFAQLQRFAQRVTGDHLATVDGVGGGCVVVRWSDDLGNCRFVVGPADDLDALAAKVRNEGRAA